MGAKPMFRQRTTTTTSVTINSKKISFHLEDRFEYFLFYFIGSHILTQKRVGEVKKGLGKMLWLLLQFDLRSAVLLQRIGLR